MNTPASRWKIWLAAAALVLAGAGIGSLATVVVAGRAIRRAIEHAGTDPDMGRRVVTRIHSRLTDDLQLDTGQAAELRRSLDTAAARMARLRMETREEVRGVLRDTFVDIDSRLRPEQSRELREKFRARLERIGFGADADRILESTAPEPAPKP